MFRLKRSLAVAMVCALMAGAAEAQTEKETAKTAGKAAAASGPKVRSEMLVSTDWLAQHLREEGIVILHVGGDKADYDAGHIPGARQLLLKDFIKNDPAGPPNELYSPEELKKAFEAVGVTDKTRVILYANDYQPAAARAYFTLDYLGQADHAALLDGGIEKWQTENRALSRETPAPKQGELTLRANPDVVITRDEVEKLGDDARLVDARPLYRYRAGHIPGAASFFWEKNLVSEESPSLLPADQLSKKLAAAGITSDKKLFVYCETGMQSSFAYFVAKYLGYVPVNYDGSMSDWKAQKKPMVKGDAKR